MDMDAKDGAPLRSARLARGSAYVLLPLELDVLLTRQTTVLPLYCSDLETVDMWLMKAGSVLQYLQCTKYD